MFKKLCGRRKVTSNSLCKVHNSDFSLYCDDETCGMIMCDKCSTEHNSTSHENKLKSNIKQLPSKLVSNQQICFLKFLAKSSYSQFFEIEFNNEKKTLKWVNVDIKSNNNDEKKRKDDIKALKDFHLREIELLKSLNCEYIMQVSEYNWATETDLIIILDHVKMNLKVANKEEKGETHQQKVKWFLQISNAVKFSHNLGVVHRNLKPQHIYLTENRNILLSGFLDAQSNSQIFFDQNNLEPFIGSEPFKAPEIRGKESGYTTATDIWALGIIYHMMLTGGENPSNTKTTNLKISKNIRLVDKDLIRKCLKLIPAERISIEDLNKELDKYQREENQNDGDTLSLEEFPANKFVSLEPLDGKNGKVYKAFDKQKKGFVALKIIKGIAFNNIEDFMNEHHSLEAINKEKNEEVMIHWKTYKEKNGKKFNLIFSLELGLANLNSLLECRKKYNQNEIFYILKQLTNGLALLNNKGICHGNICAENVVVFAKENWFIYKLVGFGYSYEIPKDSKAPKIKDISEAYASPELKKKIEKPAVTFDPEKADIYALGILCLIMMGFESGQIENAIKEISKIEFAQEYSELINLIGGMLEKELQNRFTLKKLKEKLENLRSTPPIEHLFLQKIQGKNLIDFEGNSIKCHSYTNLIEHQGSKFSLGMNLLYVGNDFFDK